MQTIDRWRRWRPSGEIIGELPGQAPSKPPKVGSEGFEGAISGTPQIISAPEHDSTSDDYDPLDDLRPFFIEWFDARVRLSPRWHTAMSNLHYNHCQWMFDHHPGLVPPTVPEFRLLIRELSLSIVTIQNEEYAGNISLKEDADAVEANRRSKGAEPPAPPARAATPALHPVAIHAEQSESTAWPLQMPDGIKLIRWEPIAPPIRLLECSVVTDTQKFISMTLRQLSACLTGVNWEAGNWPLPILLDRLTSCGVVLALDHPKGTE